MCFDVSLVSETCHNIPVCIMIIPLLYVLLNRSYHFLSEYTFPQKTLWITDLFCISVCVHFVTYRCKSCVCLCKCVPELQLTPVSWLVITDRMNMVFMLILQTITQLAMNFQHQEISFQLETSFQLIRKWFNMLMWKHICWSFSNNVKLNWH